MEAYTNIKIEMENNEIAVKATEKAKAKIMKDKLYKKDEHNVSRFINDIKVSEETIVVNNSCSLDSWEYCNLIPLLLKAIATMKEVESYDAKSNYFSCNCGYEANIDASYWNEMLTIERVEVEDFDEEPETEVEYYDI